MTEATQKPATRRRAPAKTAPAQAVEAAVVEATPEMTPEIPQRRNPNVHRTLSGALVWRG